jgi:AraC family transcriptional regulator, regulatory protein of adaptative response / methylated-DNA-[protein]-cysteine methyltransferase
LPTWPDRKIRDAAGRRGRHDTRMKHATEARRIEQACRSIESREPAPGLVELAREAGLSPAHFQRVFVAAVGVSPKAYGVAHRQRRLREALRRSACVTDAIYEAGYSANSVAYRDSQALGMAPDQFRKGGADEIIRYCVTGCSLGPILVAVTRRGVCAVEFVDSKSAPASLQQRFPRARVQSASPRQLRWVRDVVARVDNPRAAVNLPLDIRGTAFQTRVWRALGRIPAGRTMSYAQLARKIRAPTSTRAVASACASNALAVVVPCHRVVGSNGKLTGYRWGLDRKRKLLQREGVEVSGKDTVTPAA